MFLILNKNEAGVAGYEDRVSAAIRAADWGSKTPGDGTVAHLGRIPVTTGRSPSNSNTPSPGTGPTPS
jgi:hypothetical protein